MRILAIETVGATGSLAALDDVRLLLERELNPARRSAQTLAPGIAQLLADVGWSRSQIEHVAVATGPGSFTGLRIGVTTAKTLAYALGCPVVGVHTLAVVADRAPSNVEQLSVVLDAQRQELFVARLCRTPAGDWMGHEDTHIEGREAWLATLEPGTVVSGPGLERLVERLPAGVRAALEPERWKPTAESVGRMGARLAAAGSIANVFDLVPQYFRRTAAEEQWDRKERGRGEGKSKLTK